MLLGSLFLLTSCGKDTPGTAASSGAFGNSINNAIAAFESVASLSKSHNKGGVPNTYCGANGQPLDGGGGNLASSVAPYASAAGYCLSSHNSQSPDTPAGSLYSAGGLACAAGKLGLFDNLAEGSSRTVTADVVATTACWGNADQVAALIADWGGTDTLPGLEFTVTRLNASAAYDYLLSIEENGSNMLTAYMKNSDNITAALSIETNTAWSFKMDVSGGTLAYENIDKFNERWIRVLINGTFNASQAFSSISSIKGFQLQGDKAGDAHLSTFRGNTSNGLKGNFYNTNGAVTRSNDCFKAGGGEDCTTLSAIGSSTGQAATLLGAFATSYSALAAFTNSLITIPDVDPSDPDITQ